MAFGNHLDEVNRRIEGKPVVDSWLTFTDLRFVIGYIGLMFLGTAALRFPGIGAWVLPLCATVPALFVLFDRYQVEDLPGALKEMLWAALWMTGGILCAFAILYPVTTAWVEPMPSGVAPVFRGQAYVEEMFVWLRTGQGPEGDPAQFIPIHLRHLGILSVVSLGSAGVIGFLFGAVQMAYMNAYVYTLAAYTTAAPTTLLVMLIAWHVWSVLRVISFITIATALGYPMYAHFQNPRRIIPWREIGRFCVIGLALELADIGLKTMLAEPTRQLLLKLTTL